MKLRRQTAAKVGIFLASAGLFFGFFGLVRAEPRIKAAQIQESFSIDYQKFFQPVRGSQSAGPLPKTPIYTRTGGS